MRKKLLYEAPDSEALAFRMEVNFCDSTFSRNVDMGKYGGNDGSDPGKTDSGDHGGGVSASSSADIRRY